MINEVEVFEILLSVMARFADSGDMLREGLSYYSTPFETTYVYHTGRVPHIIYQEEGFIHWITGEFIDVNKGFISNISVGKVERYVYSKMLNIPYNRLEDNQALLERQHLMMTELGAWKNV